MLPNRMNRRKFLIAAGAVLGVTTLTCVGLSSINGPQPEIRRVNTTFGANNPLNEKILVTYASYAGSTAEVAGTIGQTLSESGLQVDVRPMTAVNDLSPYRAVVAGSAIHGQKWLPEAMEFIQSHRAELAQRPFAAFMVCITLGMAGGKYRDGVKPWLDPVRTLVKPVSEGLFAGVLDFSKLPLNFNTLGLRLATVAGIFPKGDCRDWNAIRAWAESTRPLLVKQA